MIEQKKPEKERRKVVKSFPFCQWNKELVSCM